MGLVRLDQVVQGLLGNGVAASTATAYVSGWRRFLAFCQQFNLAPLPLCESTLCRFVAFLAEESLCFGTVTSYLSACRFYQILAGFPDPSLSDFPQLTYVLKGVRRMVPAPKRHRLPVTPDLLHAILAVWSGSTLDFNRVMLWAAFCLGFFAFLRAGEFTCPSMERFDSSLMLAVGDVWVDSRTNPRCLTVRLKRSKCDPFGSGVNIYVGRTYQPLCPVAAMLSYLAMRPSSPGPLFVFEDGTSLSQERLTQSFAQALRLAGFDASGYSGHSFRIGAATAAARTGMSDSLIQTLGRWKSSAFMAYIRTSRDSLCAASVSLANL